MDRWENWWALNQDRYLDVMRTFSDRSRSREISGDVFLGADIESNRATPVILDRTRAGQILLDTLRQALTDPTAAVRAEAAFALGKVGTAVDVPALEALTRDQNRFVREAALLGLGLTRAEEALAPLARFLVSEMNQSDDRAFAALGLAVLGSPDSLAPLAAVLHRRGVQRELEASILYALGFVPGADAVMLLRQYADRTTNAGDLRGVATIALGKQNQLSEVPAFLILLQDEEVHVRRSAALALGYLAYRSPLWVRRDAILEQMQAWDRTRSLTAEARRRLEDLLSDIEARAVKETRDLEAVQRRAVDALSRALDRDRDHIVRHFAAMALGRIGSGEARGILIKEFSKLGRSSPARGFIALALGISRADMAADLLHQGLAKKGMDTSTKSAVALALGLIREPDSGSLLIDYATGNGDPEFRGNAAIAAGLMNHRAAIGPFRDELRRGSHTFLRPAFGLALGLLGDRDALDVLVGIAVGGTSGNTQLQAVRALASVRDVATLDVLVRLLARDDLTDLVRAEALRAAGQVGEKGFLPGLEPLARDWNYALPFTRINEAFLR